MLILLQKGTLAGHRHSYTLDNGHYLVSGKPQLVCGNTGEKQKGTSSFVFVGNCLVRSVDAFGNLAAKALYDFRRSERSFRRI
jgi:hypothetical protein